MACKRKKKSSRILFSGNIYYFNKNKKQYIVIPKIGILTKLKIDTSECPICYKTMKKGEIIKILDCIHTYHNKCIGDWFKISKSCPTCRLNYESETGSDEGASDGESETT